MSEVPPPPAAAAARAHALPPEDGDAPLEKLSRDHLSVFLFVAFTPEELLELVKRLGITVRGYRPEGLSDVERADLVADEIREVRGRRKQVLDRLRQILGKPVLNDVTLSAPVARELASGVIDDGAVARFLWRVLADPDPSVRAEAHPALDRLLAAYYPPPDGSRQPEGEEAGPPEPGVAPRAVAPGATAAAAALKQAQKEARQAERERDRAAEQAGKLREQLREARAGLASLTRTEAAGRRALEKAGRKQTALEAELALARGKAAGAEVLRLRKELKEAERRAAELEAREARLGRELAEKDEALRQLAEQAAAPKEPRQEPRQEPGPQAAEQEPEEAPSTWLLPVFTPEFYDSLKGWDRRIQRAAFKQANLLALDHRHPSLRAIALEGLPNLYRVRVATDVRLLYRRGEGNVVEILRLIDREDLDRHIKQEKSRG